MRGVAVLQPATRQPIATAEMLNRFDRVLIVYGGGHLLQQRPVLIAMLGQPSY